MPKRLHSEATTSDEDDDYSIVAASDEEDVDISSALTGKKRPKLSNDRESGDEDQALHEIIRQATSKRDVKGGTEILKKTKGKTKFTKGEIGGGSFQSMGLHPWLLRSLTLQGYRIPTPIQRLSVPMLLNDPPQDLVGMARTGSGKSLAYMIPLVQRLGGRHSTTFGARALILLPTRELALQLLRVGKELARGWHSGEGAHAGDGQNHPDSSKGQGLRWGLIVGGEGLDEQFEMITNNPDVIIATPGRLLHLIVEMNLDLKGVQYVVFDEADRLFEMGFETALNEIIHRLPTSRQTLLFSATLPKSLVEFAKAGLDNPKLVRLDAESKISTDLKMAFFSIKQAEKDACLLILLRDIIGVPVGGAKEAMDDPEDDTKGPSKGKGKRKARDQYTAPHQTLIFAATKHHVEYLTVLLTTVGYSVSQIYGTLDQTARSIQMDRFRRGVTNILVVTDVAARGIDIPVLENVVNYDFPQGARVFVHRVGRTARAGRAGWAWSLLTNQELPYLLDLQLFLGRPLKSRISVQEGDGAYTESLILGPFPRDRVDEEMEYVNGLEEEEHNLPTLRGIMKKGHGMYERSKGKASQASYKRAKDMTKDAAAWGLVGHSTGIHPVLAKKLGDRISGISQDKDTEEKRLTLLKLVNSFRPSETVFEVAHKSKGAAANSSLMKERRKALTKAVERAALATATVVENDEDEDAEEDAQGRQQLELADEEDIAAVFDPSSSTKGKKGKQSYKDSEFYMSYVQKDADTEKGYSLRDGASFVEQANNVAFDLVGDEGVAAQRRKKMMTWDKKKKKFVQGDGAGADNVKMVKTESGTKLPATYRSGRFDEWKAKNRTSLPRVGEIENGKRGGHTGRKYQHNKITPAKGLDKLNTDYERKSRQQKKKQDSAAGGDAEESRSSNRPNPGGKKPALGKRFGGKSIGRVKTELKTVDQIRKARKVVENKRAKNARPSRKGHGGHGKRR